MITVSGGDLPVLYSEYPSKRKAKASWETTAPAGDVVEMAEDLRKYVLKYPQHTDFGSQCDCSLCEIHRLVYKWNKRLSAPGKE